MSFSDAVRTCLSRYAVFSGRATRPEYWWFQLFSNLAALCIYLAFVLASGVSVMVLPSVAKIAVVLLLAVLALGGWGWLFLASLAVFVRRMHDTNHSGAWGLLCLIPFGAVVPLIFACTEGGAPNQYGPAADPRWGNQLGGYPSGGYPSGGYPSGGYASQPYPQPYPTPGQPYPEPNPAGQWHPSHPHPYPGQAPPPQQYYPDPQPPAVQ